MRRASEFQLSFATKPNADVFGNLFFVWEASRKRRLTAYGRITFSPPGSARAAMRASFGLTNSDALNVYLIHFCIAPTQYCRAMLIAGGHSDRANYTCFEFQKGEAPSRLT
jgi:hypothetical protein